MTRTLIPSIVFLAGLAVLGWVGAGYAASNLPALAVTLLIAACYVTGAVELRRYRQATDSLAQAVAGLDTAPASLGDWLQRLHPSLRHAVRLRVEGERAALPGPALTPYLVGLLVLLGMLGTFLGMVATLRGTGMALDSATDLQAIRASLAAPVKGLGFAFGTSVAGVATSAMLGLLSALFRRERIEAAQALDARATTTLRAYSQQHQREASLQLLERQAEAMPGLVEGLQAMMRAVAQQNQELGERLAASQAAFHDRTESTYKQLAASVEQSLKDSVAHSAQAAGAAIQPAVETTMAGLAREAETWRDTVTHAVQQQLDGLSERFATTTGAVAGLWQQALTEHQRAGTAQAEALRSSLDGFAATFAQRSAGLVEQVSARLDLAADKAAQAWEQALTSQRGHSEALAADHRKALAGTAAAFAGQAEALLRTVDRSHAELQAQLGSQDAQRLDAWTSALGTVADGLRQQWEQTGTQAAARQQAICDALAQSARDISSQAEAYNSKTVAEIDRLVLAAAEAPKAALAMQAELAARDEQRLATWTDSLATMAQALRQEWEQTGTQAAARQQAICDALAQSARDISSQAEAYNSKTVAEIDRLVLAAAEAPKAALAMQAELAARDEQRLATWTESLATMAQALRQEWEQTGTQAAARQQAICDALAQSARDISSQAEAYNSKTVAEIDRLVLAAAEAPKAALAMQAELAARDEQRLTNWTESLATMAQALRQEWEQTGTQAAARQQAICDALAQSARDISSQAEAYNSKTVAEIDRLVLAAAEAPKAALAMQAELAARDEQRLATWTDSLATMAQALRQEWEQTGTQAAARQQAICDTLAQSARDISSQAEAYNSKTVAEIDRLVLAAAEAPKAALAMQAELAARDEQRLATWTESLATMAQALRQEWEQTGTQAAARQQAICDALAQSARDISSQAEAYNSKTVAEIDRLVLAAAEAPKAALAMQAELAARDEQRLATWTDSLATMAQALRQEWEQTGTQAAARQQAICDTLADTARGIAAQAQAHHDSSVAEVARLMQAAAEAPRAAAETLGELRQKLSDSMARDQAMLEERAGMLSTLETLLQAVGQASTEQRAAVESLVAGASSLLEQAGARFAGQVESEGGRLEAMAAQVTGSAVEVASLGEAFGMAVQLFSESSDKLGAQLQRIEAALDKSMARSDEQLAYYVAQAREVVDLSVMSQKQILDDLQQLAATQAANGAEAA
ncbi:hypothetical protein BKK81_27405 [Cupriavidus sp. USMAHM13]|uniref:DUF802 domain-containing protein n=1 Tax=Cupriavidus sp. USMAHM13 TaxID=1389192 RepID=UPI0008A6BAAA|nr:DUF802 domain-containing protein [Cupriavidus sp. USMAHM13]AOZ02896.1 hypothetical protein BKK81_27405 [Cupriavidus sp. USMAHM13]